MKPARDAGGHGKRDFDAVAGAPRSFHASKRASSGGGGWFAIHADRGSRSPRRNAQLKRETEWRSRVDREMDRASKRIVCLLDEVNRRAAQNGAHFAGR